MTGVGECEEGAERGFKICVFYEEEEGCGCGTEGKGKDRPGDICGNATWGAFSHDGRSGWKSVEAGSCARRRRGQRPMAMGSLVAGAVPVAAAAGSMGGGTDSEADAAAATTSTTTGAMSGGNGRG